jgi:putative CocE/NonD family hydrolase
MPTCRRARTLATLLAPLAVAATTLATAAPAAAAPPQWTPDQPTWAVYTQKDVPITMRDGVVLRANVGIPMPQGASAPDPSKHFPVLIEQTPYRKDGGLFTVDAYFVQRGFAMVVVDVRGTGSSQGVWQSFYGPEQTDGPQIVRWAAHQPWANGRAGLMGASYLAINQLLTMEQPDAPSEVKAIFPVVPMSDSYRDVTYHGGNLDSAFIPPWLGLVTGLGAPPGNQAFDGNPQDVQDGLKVAVDHVVNATQFQVPVTVDATTGGAKTYDSAYYQSTSPIWRINRVHVPTFVVGGEFDIFQRGEPLLYNALDVPAKRLVMGPWVHLQGSTASSLPADGIPDLKTLQLQWFDEYLKGVPTGEDAQPRVYQYELKGTDASHFVASPSYPVGEIEPRNLYLQPGTSGSAHSLNDGNLGDARPAAAGSDPLPYVPTGTPCSRTTFQWGDASAGNVPCETDERVNELQELTYTTPALTAPLTVNGPINVHLVAESTNGQNMPFTVRLTDVAPNGTSTQLTAGWLLASMRATANSPVTQRIDDTVMRVFHPFTQQGELPVPTAPTAYDIEVFPTFATFQTGHRIRLDVGTGDSPHMTLSAPHQAQATGALFMVDRNPDNPSYVSLPVVAQRSAEAQLDSALQAASTSGSTTAVTPAAHVGLPNTSAARTPAWPGPALLAGAGVALVARRRRSRRGTMRRDVHSAPRRAPMR